MGSRRGGTGKRSGIPLAAFSLGLVVLMDFCNLSALYSYHKELQGRDSSSSTSSQGRLRTVQSQATMKRSLLRSTNDTRSSPSSSSSHSADPAARQEINKDANESIPAPSPSVRALPIPSLAKKDPQAEVALQPPVGTPPPGESPYEVRWPDYWLPAWAKKRYNELIPNAHLPPPKSICYVHVGKAAGSTIGCALGFRLHCKGDMWHPPKSLLYRYTTNVHHSNVNDCSLHHDYYLVTLRDPVERLLSWYEYDQEMLDALRVECGFTTLNDLATKGLPRRRSVAAQGQGGGRVFVDDGGPSTSCRRRARRAIRGEEQFGYHAYHNYNYHMRQVPSNATVAAIRSEHLVQDWNSMEALLGSEGRVASFPRKNRADNSTQLSRYLSDVGRDFLCRYLCDEIQVYKSILERAVNLEPKDVQISMDELRKSCPREADVPSCPL